MSIGCLGLVRDLFGLPGGDGDGKYIDRQDGIKSQPVP